MSKREKRPSLANHQDWLGAHGRRIYLLEREVNGNGVPGLRQEISSVKGSIGTVKLQLRWIIAIAIFTSTPALALAAWIVNYQIRNGEAIAALTAAIQTSIK